MTEKPKGGAKPRIRNRKAARQVMETGVAAFTPEQIAKMDIPTMLERIRQQRRAKEAGAKHGKD